MEEKKNHPRISVVIPFFNEEENIGELYRVLIKVLKKLNTTYELIFIDDGSFDNTYQILTELYQEDENIQLIRLKKNFGQTAALQAGFDVAQGEVIISMDGDLQIPIPAKSFFTSVELK